jgi:hypothetical protein
MTKAHATTVIRAMSARGHWEETREGSLRESQMMAAPAPTAAKKATPKYQ